MKICALLENKTVHSLSSEILPVHHRQITNMSLTIHTDKLTLFIVTLLQDSAKAA